MNKRQGRAISRPAPDGATAHPTPSKWPTGHRNTGSPTSGTAALTERNIHLASHIKRHALGQRGDKLRPVRMARQFVAVWDGLQQSWLIRRDFDLTAEITEAFREISGSSPAS